MKKVVLVLLIMVLFPYLVEAQNQQEKRTIERSGDKAFLVENGLRSIIDETIVIAKPKSKASIPNSLLMTKDIGFGIKEISVPNNVKVEDFVSQLIKTGEYDFVDYNIYGEYALYPSDDEIGNQWYLESINAYEAWDITTGNPQIRIAVLDSGVDSGHNDLSNGFDGYSNLNISDGYCFPNNTTYSMPFDDHGTMVAGIIGAKTNNALGIAGITGGNYAAGTTILPYCVGYYDPSVNYVISAIYKAVEKNARLINMSLYFTNNNSGLECAIDSAYNKGITIICATGNNGMNNIPYPACYPNTIAVGGSNLGNSVSIYSNYGIGLDMVAPAVNIKSTSFNNGYQSYNGNSFAAPQVTGVAALMLSVNPTLTPIQIRDTLRSTCTKLSGYTYNSAGWNEEAGYGLLNAQAAVHAIVHASKRIVGSYFIDDSNIYYVEDLPPTATVEWSLSDSYYDANCLDQNDPTQNQCTITRDYSRDMTNATLTATIKYNGDTIQTFTKTGLYAHYDFKGHYTSAVGSGDINYTHIFTIKPNWTYYVTSPHFYGATVTYGSNGATPSIWGFSPTYGDLTFVSTDTSLPVVINVNDIDGNYYQLVAFPNNNPLSFSYGDNSIVVSINEDEDSIGGLCNLAWSIEIRDTTTGELMATQTSTTRSAIIYTSGWPKGMYVVKVTVDKEVFREKILVN
jgi:subtilisin family serine protease